MTLTHTYTLVYTIQGSLHFISYRRACGMIVYGLQIIVFFLLEKEHYQLINDHSSLYFLIVVCILQTIIYVNIFNDETTIP